MDGAGEAQEEERQSPRTTTRANRTCSIRGAAAKNALSAICAQGNGCSSGQWLFARAMVVRQGNGCSPGQWLFARAMVPGKAMVPEGNGSRRQWYPEGNGSRRQWIPKAKRKRPPPGMTAAKRSRRPVRLQSGQPDARAWKPGAHTRQGRRDTSGAKRPNFATLKQRHSLGRKLSAGSYPDPDPGPALRRFDLCSTG